MYSIKYCAATTIAVGEDLRRRASGQIIIIRPNTDDETLAAAWNEAVSHASEKQLGRNGNTGMKRLLGYLIGDFGVSLTIF